MSEYVHSNLTIMTYRIKIGSDKICVWLIMDASHNFLYNLQAVLPSLEADVHFTY